MGILLCVFRYFCVVLTWMSGKAVALLTSIQAALLCTHVGVSNAGLASHFSVNQVRQVTAARPQDAQRNLLPQTHGNLNPISQESKTSRHNNEEHPVQLYQQPTPLGTRKTSAKPHESLDQSQQLDLSKIHEYMTKKDPEQQLLKTSTKKQSNLSHFSLSQSQTWPSQNRDKSNS